MFLNPSIPTPRPLTSNPTLGAMALYVGEDLTIWLPDEPKLWDDKVTFSGVLGRESFTYLRLTEKRFAALRRVAQNAAPRAILGTSQQREQASRITKRFAAIEACVQELMAAGWDWPKA